MKYVHTDGMNALSHMTRRTFVSAAALAGGTAVLAGLTSCAPGSSPANNDPAPAPDGPANETEATPSASKTSNQTPVVYFTHAVEPAALQAVFDAIGEGLTGKVGV